VEAARELFLERGYEATTVQDIAEAADVSPGTVFGYFPTKADIFFAGYDELVDDFVAWLESRPEGVTAIESAAAWDATVAARIKKAPRSPDLLWRRRSRAMADASPTLSALERQRYSRAEDALARAVAADLGDEPDAIRPRLIAAMREALAFETARVDTAGTDESARAYMGACFAAAAEAMAAVPPPPARRGRRRRGAARD
jgi:AcrR family transcriptional regulator